MPNSLFDRVFAISGQRSSARSALFLVALLALALALATGCASAPRPAALPEPMPVESLAPATIPDEAITLVLLAREHARLGLAEEADAAYERALSMLEPLAARDEKIAAQADALREERERVLAELELALAEAAEASGDEASEALVELDPVFHPDALGGVEEAIAEVEPDWPVVKNERVLAWIEVYTGRLRQFTAESLARSGRHIERFREIFAEEGLPRDLVYLALTESGFKERAYSRAHAKGIFQFIRATGRRYGLQVDWYLDERADPEKSCRASAAYLRDLYEEFGDWSLALAAYNTGEGRVRRAIRRAGTRDYWELSRRRLFFRETRNYVPAIMAATIIAKNPERFGFDDVVYEEPLTFDTVVVDAPTDLEIVARLLDVDVDTLQAYNPAIRRMQTPPNVRDFVLRVPVGSGENFAAKLAEIPLDERITRVEHRVRRGDTLSGIARRYGTTVSAIQASNSMGRRTLLRIGQVLVVPRGPGSPVSLPPAQLSADGSYRVRRGDTLSTIARRFRMSVAELQQLNGMGRSTRIIAGQRLRVRGEARDSGVARARAVAPGGTYVVRRGDSPWTISEAHGVELSDLLALNGLTRRSTIRPGDQLRIPADGAALGAARASRSNGAAPAAASRYVVRRGDSPWIIARRLGVPLSDLLRVNGLSRRSTIRPGDVLRIPAAGGSGGPREAATSIYVVRRGDTLSRIARRHGLSIERLCALNDLAPDSTIYPGDRLTLR